MTTSTMTSTSSSGAQDASSIARPASRWSRLWTWVQFVACLGVAGGVLVYLLGSLDSGSPGSSGTAASESDPRGDVRVTGPRSLCLRPDCPLCRRLQVTTVSTSRMTVPVMTVTGVVAASLRPGNGKGSDYWQFNSPELLTAFTDWQKATVDIAFAETQLTAIKQLADTKIDAQQKLVERMQKLVAAGTETEKDCAAAQADLIQSQIQGRKDVHEADTALRLAQRTEAALARQLQQGGLEPDMLRSISRDIDIVMADVPEGLMSRVTLGEGCEAQFFGLPAQSFPGKVRAIAPVLSKERRSLRVLFAIHDPQDQLRPGMFADIGLGTDARDALLIPAEAVVHVGRADYVLVGSGKADWQVTEVHVGELHDTAVEVLSGLRAGDRIAGKGVILLKPSIIEALQPTRGSQQAMQTASLSGGNGS